MIIDRIDEEFLLFAIRPDGRWVVPRKGALQYGLAGAWLAELLVDGYIRIDHNRVLARGSTSAGERTLDWALGQLRGKRPTKIHKWVYRLGRAADEHRHAVMQRLEGRGHIQVVRENGHYRYPQHNAEARSQLKDQLRSIIYGSRPPDDATVGLLAVLDGAGYTEHIFGRELDQNGRLLLERMIHRDHRFHNLHNAVRETKGWTLAQLF